MEYRYKIGDIVAVRSDLTRKNVIICILVQNPGGNLERCHLWKNIEEKFIQLSVTITDII